MPPELAVRARVGDGDLTVTGLRGALHLTVPRGDVALSEISGPTVARVGEGSLVALGVRSPTVEVHGDEGLLSLAFASVPQRVEAVLGQGSLSVDLPDEGLYRVEGGVVEGSERIDVAIREAAPSMVIARVTEGSLDIG
ncbi:hypothetical protein [Nonomuraea sp. NPDC050310]|uniref:hypothetical protein n=1 Tax=Nonomuraea sp. NPDC050310 TaxID=3154935 RepID=UPI0033EA17EE